MLWVNVCLTHVISRSRIPEFSTTSTDSSLCTPFSEVPLALKVWMLIKVIHQLLYTQSYLYLVLWTDRSFCTNNMQNRNKLLWPKLIITQIYLEDYLTAWQFNTRAFHLPIYELLTRFIVPCIISFIWRRLHIKSEGE